MDWNALRIFLAVSETGSLVAAAPRAGVSHATVFRHINALEADMGTRLFDRARGRYALTEAGQELQALAREIARGFEAIDRRVAGRDGEAEGLVRITAPRSFADRELPRYLTDLRRECPGIAVEIVTSNHVLDLSDRSADIALRVADSPPDHLWGRRLLSIGWSVYASPDWRRTCGPATDLSERPGQTLLAPAGTLAGHPAYRAAQAAGGRWDTIGSDDLTTLASLAAHGHGAALLPDDLARPGLERCFGFAAAPPNTLWLLTHPDLRDIRRIALVMGALAKAFSRDPRWKSGGVQPRPAADIA
jgi:molybdate transport repressor ModE-like protein